MTALTVVASHTHIGKKRKPMNRFSHGYHGLLYCSWANVPEMCCKQEDMIVFRLSQECRRDCNVTDKTVV